MRDPVKLRKAIHTAFISLLFVPYAVPLLEPRMYYAALAVSASLLYALQVKQPQLAIKLVNDLLYRSEEMFEKLQRIAPGVDRLYVREQYERFREEIIDMVRSVERDYEKKSGYVGMLLGIMGIYITNTLFGDLPTLTALTSLAVYDTVSGIVGARHGRRRFPHSRASLEGSLAGALANAAVLAPFLGLPAVLISAIAVLAEAYGVEDNMSIPLAVGLTTYILLGQAQWGM